MFFDDPRSSALRPSASYSIHRATPNMWNDFSEPSSVYPKLIWSLFFMISNHPVKRICFAVFSLSTLPGAIESRSRCLGCWRRGGYRMMSVKTRFFRLRTNWCPDFLEKFHPQALLVRNFLSAWSWAGRLWNWKLVRVFLLKKFKYFGMPLSFCLSVFMVAVLVCLYWSALLCFVLSPCAEVFSVRSFSPWLRLENSSEAAFQAVLKMSRTCRERIPDIQGKVVLCDAWRSVKCEYFLRTGTSEPLNLQLLRHWPP